MKCLKHLIIVVLCLVLALVSAGLFYVAYGKSEAVMSSQKGKRIYPLIILDAGHGGLDGGAVAQDGTEEQYINLDITLKLNNILRVCGYKTLLTRADNNSIHDADAKTIREQKVSDIHNRLKIVESNPDCIFVSVHQNFYTQTKYSGAQVFYSPNNDKSQVLAEFIQQNIITQLQPENTRMIKESGKSIYLLFHSTEVSVLVECGFLSNPEETTKLNDENYRRQMAMSIFGGIIQYLISEA